MNVKSRHIVREQIMGQRYAGRSIYNDLLPVIYGYEACKPGHSFGPAVRSHYLLHYVLEGEGEFIRRGETYKIHKGDIFVIEPDEVTTYRTGNIKPWEYSWLGFEFLGGQHPACLDSPVIHKAPVRQIFTQIKEHLSDEEYNERIFILCCELMMTLSARTGSGSRDNDYAEYTRNYLDRVYMQHVTIQEIADSLFIDRRYLTALFHDSFGLSPKEYLTELRLRKATEFLELGYSVSETAMMTGFGDIANFSRKYKAYHGVSPSRTGKGR